MVSRVARSFEFFVLFAVCCLLSVPASAAVPHLIRYQGQASDANGVPLEGPYSLTFRLYNAETLGTVLWQETPSNVSISKGHFSVLLGQVTPLNVDWSAPLWLSIQVGTGTELSPRQRITSVPLALRAAVAESLAGGGTDISARVYNSASISVASGTWTALTFNSELWDTDNIHDTATNTGRLTAKTPGKYLIYATLRFEPDNTGVRRLHIYLNGRSIAQQSTDALVEGRTNLAIATHYNLAANDYVELVVYQNSGRALPVEAAGDESLAFGMVKLP